MAASCLARLAGTFLRRSAPGLSGLRQTGKSVINSRLTGTPLTRTSTPVIRVSPCRSLTTLSGWHGNQPGPFTCSSISSSVSGFTASVASSLLRVSSPAVGTVRTKIRCSKRAGKPKSVKAVVERFYRLNWGIWIRTRSGRHKRLWKKSRYRIYRLQQHVFCNKQQSKLLDKMTTGYWHRKRHYPEDPYEPYHKRVGTIGDMPVYRKPPFLP